MPGCARSSPSDTLARFGGDEFVLLLPDLDHPGEAEEVAERLLLELTRPHKVNGHELHISAIIGIAIDDFGTGLSSLSYLRTLPIDKIKIDRTFVRDVTGSDKDAAICQGVITLARELDLRVVAEGIETRDQHDYLRHHGCEVFQGFLCARPMPLDALVAWLEARPQP